MAFLIRHAAPHSNGFYRSAQGRTVSSLGIGTYLGDLSAEADQAYEDSVYAAVAGGINVIDTAINYRQTRSERNIGQALARVFADGLAERDDLLVCTKAGFLTPGAVPAGLIPAAEVCGGMHCMAPGFLEDQIGRSLAHLGLDALDVFYCHNPETQLAEVSREEFHDRLRRAFERLEAICRQGRIRWYGAATWSGLRLPPSHPQSISLPELLALAREASGGDGHHLRFIQLPFNLAMTEAMQGSPSLLEVAAREGVTVVGSAALLQGRLLSQLSGEWISRLPGPRTAAGFALQFARSVPGIAVALAGMGKPSHVTQNLEVAGYRPASEHEIRSLFPAEA